MTRRAAAIVVALVVAALVGVGLLAIPGSPFEQRPTLGLDLQGGLEVTLQAVPPRDRELTKEDLDRSVSIMRDRVDKLGVCRAGDPDAGRRPDLDPAAGRQGPGRGRGDHRQDRAARALRPAGEPRCAVDRRQDEAADRDAEALRPPRGPAVTRREGRAGHVLRLRDEGQEARPGARELEGGGAREVGRQAPARAQALRGAARHGGRELRHRRGELPRGRPAEPDEQQLVPLPLHPARGARDDGQGSRPQRDAAGLRHAHGRADRPDGLHGQGLGQVRGHHARDRAAGQAPLQHRRRRPGRLPATGCRASRSCSTARSSRIRRSTSRSTRAASPARTARRSPASGTSATRRTSRWCSRRARSRSSSAPSTRPPSPPRSGRTRSRRPRRPRSSACSPSRSSCSSSIASSASSPSSASASTRRSSTPRSSSSTSR